MKRALLIAPMFVLLAACGGGSGSGTGSGTTDPGKAELKYAKCMRDNGVPSYPDDGKNFPAGGLEIPDRAVAACKHLHADLGAKTVDPSDPKTRDRFLKLARCMRGQGFDWPDPTATSLGGPAPDLSNVPDKAKFEAGMKVCQKDWS